MVGVNLLKKKTKKALYQWFPNCSRQKDTMGGSFKMQIPGLLLPAHEVGTTTTSYLLDSEFCLQDSLTLSQKFTFINKKRRVICSYCNSPPPGTPETTSSLLLSKSPGKFFLNILKTLRIVIFAM